MSDYSTAVANSEEAGTATESYDEDRGLMNASVTLRCAYGDRHVLAGDICGNLRAWPKGAAGLVPVARGASIVMAQPLQGGSVTGGGQLIPYDALVTIHYTTKNQEVVTESYEPFVQSLRLDYRLFSMGYLGAGGRLLKEDEAPGVLYRGINFVRNELFVIPPLSDDLLDLVGCVNSEPYYSTFMGRMFDAGTLLYCPPTINRKYTSIGDIKYDLTKKFTYQPQGWNTFYDAITNSWQQIYYIDAASVDDPFLVYPEESFANILPSNG